MTKSHAIGSLAATAMVALLTGLPPASADELADLKANQAGWPLKASHDVTLTV